MKKLLIILVGLGIGSVFAGGMCSGMSESAESSASHTGYKMNSSDCHCLSHPKPSLNPTMMVGGWYPVFFNEYNKKQVDQIIQQVKDGKVDSIKISYDQSAKLAKKIQARIQAKTNFKVELDHVATQDTATTQYNHTQVVVTVYQTKPVPAKVAPIKEMTLSPSESK